MHKWTSSCFPGVLRSWQASSCSQRAVVEHMRTCWADDSAALFPEVPVGEGLECQCLIRDILEKHNASQSLAAGVALSTKICFHVFTFKFIYLLSLPFLFVSVGFCQAAG